MRKLWLLAGLALLGMAGLASAQITPISLGVNNPANLNSMTMPTTGQTINLNQMMPKLNPSSAFIKPQNPRTFNFNKLIPNFSWMKTGLLPRSATTQLPTMKPPTKK